MVTMPMTPEELKAIIAEVYGAERGGQQMLAADIGRGEVTISRWASGTTPIREMEARLIRIIVVLHRRAVNWRKWLADYNRERETNLTLEDLL